MKSPKILGFALAFVASLSGAEAFRPVTQKMDLALNWSKVDSEKEMELQALHVPTKLKVTSITLSQNLEAMRLIVDLVETNGKRQMEHRLNLLPSIELKRSEKGTYLEVGALIYPSQMGSNAPDGDSDSDRVDRYYFVLTFQTDSKFTSIRNLSLVLMNSRTWDRYHSNEIETEVLRYESSLNQLELTLNDPIKLPPVIDTHAALGSKTQNVHLRFVLPQDNRAELRDAGIPEVLELPSIEVAAGLLGVQVKLPFRQVALDQTALNHFFSPSLFEINAQTPRHPLRFTHELTTGFSSMDESYRLEFEFSTDENFSAVAAPKLSLYKEVTTGDGYHSYTSRDLVLTYVLEEVQFELPIYPGDQQ